MILMPVYYRCHTNGFSGRVLPILLNEVIKSSQWEDAPAILSAFKDVILKLTNGLDADAAASLEKLLSELPAPEKNISCSYWAWTEIPTGLKQCIKTTGSCYHICNYSTIGRYLVTARSQSSLHCRNQQLDSSRNYRPILDRMIATFSCLVDSGMKGGEDSKSAMICQMLSSFTDVAGDKEAEVSKLLSGQLKNRNSQQIALDYKRKFFKLQSGPFYPQM